MFMKLEIPAGKSLYYDAPFDVRRRLSETFVRFNVNDRLEVIGESLLRLERMSRKARRYNYNPAERAEKDCKSAALFQMLDYYKSLK
jgi:hypothetical protein